MQQQFKKYLSIFFLFLLLFPLAEKSIHGLEHQKDIHCTAIEKHFHEQEHSCSICDFTLIDSNVFPEKQVAFLIAIQNFSFLPFSQKLNIPHEYSNLPSRGPPTI
jgi:hypothetical protein